MFSPFRPFLDFVFPPLCLACGERRNSRASRVCPACWDRIRPVDDRSSLFLETASALRVGGDVSGLVSAYVFEKDGTLQTLLHALKYGGNSAIGKELGEALARRLAMMPWSSRITAVVPVPLHPVKKRERGFNQAEIVAEAVAGGLGVPLRIDLLDRIRHTATQTHLGTKERQQNMAGAFRVRVRAGCAPREEHILLVDDVVTTGATIVEAAGALLASGAAECFAGTVAIAAL